MNCLGALITESVVVIISSFCVRNELTKLDYTLTIMKQSSLD